ncbi:mesotocin receptor-like [Paramacrobiotus metropolitanus]|uniref:mesotocin receptor-like n=1 Tax=Paramacrobiotus metropolitanus TaxID=2943436 RepID=UPI002445674B|nr:mesotocin receptor-like [Paramacrobiotus metropolitanus]
MADTIPMDQAAAAAAIASCANLTDLGDIFHLENVDVLDNYTLYCALQFASSVVQLQTTTGRVMATETVQHIVLMGCFMAVALLGNIAVLVHLFNRSTKHRQISIFVTSLAATDILIAIFSMSTELLWEALGEWIFGNFACKFSTYIQCMLFFSTAFILMSMSYDRYEAICKPMAFSCSAARSRKMVVCSWCLALILAVPQVFVFVQVETGNHHADGSPQYICRSHGYTAEWQRKIYVTWVAACVFIIPLFFITFCYISIARVVFRNATQKVTVHNGETLQLRRNTPSVRSGASNHLQQSDRSRVRTIQLTAVILMGYIICWTPYFTLNLYNVWTDYRYKNDIPAAVRTVARCMGWSSSCVNPFIYAFFHCRRIRGAPRVGRETVNLMLQSFRSGTPLKPSQSPSPRSPRLVAHFNYETVPETGQFFHTVQSDDKQTNSQFTEHSV